MYMHKEELRGEDMGTKERSSQAHGSPLHVFWHRLRSKPQRQV